VEYTFAVTDVWKGTPEDTIRVGSSGFGGACGQDFGIGIRYLVYARKINETLVTDICMRNAPLDDAVWDLYWLPKSKAMRHGHATKWSLENLFGFLDSGTRAQAHQAAEALGNDREHRSMILPRLRAIVRGDEPGNVELAVDALQGMESAGREALGDLGRILVKGSDREKAASLMALRRMSSDEEFYPHLLTALGDSTELTLVAACENVACLNRADSTRWRAPAGKLVGRLLGHPNENVRAHAAYALSYLPSVRSAWMSTLFDMSKNDRSSYVRGAATSVIRNPWVLK